MNREQLDALVQKIEQATGPDLDLGIETLRQVRDALPDLAGGIRPGLVDSTDEVLRLVSTRHPGWSVELKGKAREPDGRWTCTLRESGARDDEEVIGIGHGPTVPFAIISALLHVAMIREKGYR
jgi:hypothetical protein